MQRVFRLVDRLRFDLRAIQRYQTHLDQTGLGTQLQHLYEQPLQLGQMELAEIADRSEVRNIVTRNNAIRRVPFATLLDSTGRVHPHAVTVQK
ncbi:MAG: hypothetical protein WBE26_20050 [Phycisphaerae bacterium]